jgi:molybdenum cofactor biosynthesis enzyme MoaA
MDNVNELLSECPYIEDFYLTGGECFLSPIIEEIIEKLSSKANVTVFTNGTILNNYDDLRLKKLSKNIKRFIVTLDSLDSDNYICRLKLKETISLIKRLVTIDKRKLEVKICVNNFNYFCFEKTIKELISIGVNFLSINFVFDIKRTELKHELKKKSQLIEVFRIIKKYKSYFNMQYINMLYDLYIENQINENYPCLADEEYFFLDSSNQYLICPGNKNNIGKRGDWKKCFSRECANEWEMMYER